jgi:uncharacterized protein YoxC
MSQQIVIDIVAQTDKLTAEINKSTSKIQGLTKAFVGIGVAAKGFSTASGFINKTTDAASDLEETMSKTSVLFGKNSKEVVAFSKNAAKSFGQSKQQALNAASTFATFGKAAGVAGKDLVKFSTDFVGLASDLASFNNTSPEQAINAIGSALRGEAEPLRAYGVLLNDATLKNAALELGLISTTKNALTPQQKVLAAQKVIYEQTTAAQGDFARTSDGLANSTRILEAEQANLNANIGQTFLPIMKQVNSIMMVAVEAFTSLPDPVQKIAVGLGLVVAVGGPLVVLLGSIKTAMVALQISTISLTTVMSALPFVAVGLAIVLLITHFDDISKAVEKVWEAVSKWFGKVYEDIKDFVGKAIDWLKENWPKILAVLTGPFGLFVKWLVDNKDDILQKAKDIYNTVKDWLGENWSKILAILTGPFGLLIAFFVKYKDEIVTKISEIWEAVKTKTVEWLDQIVAAVIEVWTAVSDFVLGAVELIRDGIVKKWNTIVADVQRVFDALKKSVKVIWDNIVDGAADFVTRVIEKFKDVFGLMIQVGKDIANGVWAGLNSMKSFLKNKFNEFFGDLLPGWAKLALKIASPSQVFVEVGQNIVRGLAGGITSGVNVTAPRLAGRSSGSGVGGINITINAGLGTNGAALGRDVSSAIRQYGKVSTKASF